MTEIFQWPKRLNKKKTDWVTDFYKYLSNPTPDFDSLKRDQQHYFRQKESVLK